MPDFSLAKSADDGLAAIWARWKAAFMRPEGRIADPQQGDASHSESQAYGLMLAEANGDQESFERLEAWTNENLAVRRDALLAWRWLPGVEIAVPDWRCATDGDLFRAWALLRAADRFGQEAYRRRAAAIAADISAICTAPDPRANGRLLLLATDRDVAIADGRAMVNPSYIMPRALGELAVATGIASLGAAAADGRALLDELAGRGTVPDWVEIGPDGPRPAPNRPDGSSYDAIRVPLNLIWSGLFEAPAVGVAAARYVSAGDGDVPVAFDAGGRITATSDLAGYRAVANLTLCAAGQRPGRPSGADAFRFYYPAALHGLALLAKVESGLSCDL